MFGETSNLLTNEAIVNIVNSLEVNNALEVLWLPVCSEEIKKKISSLQEVIKKNRESRGCLVNLTIDYYGELSSSVSLVVDTAIL